MFLLIIYLIRINYLIFYIKQNIKKKINRLKNINFYSRMFD